MRDLAKNLVIGTPLEPLARRLLGQPAFDSSGQYWTDRYRARGGDSGSGSYGRLARCKADVLNGFVREAGVRDVVELGCGDGHQLGLADYPAYRGFDVAPGALQLCRERFAEDPTTSFLPMAQLRPEQHAADLALSLDVVYHLVEDEVYERYMAALFDVARKHVVVYSSDGVPRDWTPVPHVRHRCFTDWVATHRPDWELGRTVPNPYPWDPERPATTSFADFYFFRRVGPT